MQSGVRSKNARNPVKSLSPPSRCRLYFDCDNFAVVLDHKIYFMPALLMPVGQLCIGHVSFQQCGQILSDERFEERPAEQIVMSRFEGADAGHVRCQPAVGKVQLGRFDKAGTAVFQKRRQSADEKRCFQKIKIASRRSSAKIGCSSSALKIPELIIFKWNDLFRL